MQHKITKLLLNHLGSLSSQDLRLRINAIPPQHTAIIPQIKKKPSTSEIIDWIQALVHGGFDPEDIVKEVPYVGVLLKKNEDIDTLKRYWR